MLMGRPSSRLKIQLVGFRLVTTSEDFVCHGCAEMREDDDRSTALQFLVTGA